MSKPLLGLILGAILGLLDGASAWFTPEVRPVILSIIIGSTFKGLVTGVIAGWVARVTNSIVWALITGLAVGLLLSWWVAANSPGPDGQLYYMQIMLPGCILGGIAGFASQRFGRQRAVAAAAMLMVAGIALPMHAAERTIRAETIVNAPVAQVYASWTTPAGLAKFFAPKSIIDPRPGGEYTVVFYPDVDAEGSVFGTKGAHVLAVEPQKSITFEWITFVTRSLAGHSTPPVVSEAERNVTPLPTAVTIRFEPLDASRTRVTLEHRGFRSGGKWDEAFAYFDRAWNGVLASLTQSYAK